MRATDAPELGWGCGQDFPEGQESSRRAQGTTRSDHVHKHKSPPGREHQWKAGEGCTPGSALNPRWGRPVLTCPHLGHPSPVVTCPRPMTSLTCLTCPRPRTSLTWPHLSSSQDIPSPVVTCPRPMTSLTCLTCPRPRTSLTCPHLSSSQDIPHLSSPILVPGHLSLAFVPRNPSPVPAREDRMCVKGAHTKPCACLAPSVLGYHSQLRSPSLHDDP